MGHKTSRAYIDLQKRLDKSPQGAPATDSLFKILEILFTKEEALLVSKLPIRMFTVEKAAKIWKKPKKETRQILDTLADKGLMIDLSKGNTKHYILAPTMAGFFEFSLMRTDGRFDRKLLSQLFHEYINVEDKFLKRVFTLNPPIARTFVSEGSLEKEDELTILDYERATKVIDSASCITVGTCYCRHKMEHMGKACKMPQDVCLTFNNCAKSLSKHGVAKEISKKEAHEVLKRCVSLGLVQIGDNVQDNVSFICNCCGCCCEALLGYKRLGYMPKINTNYEPKIKEACTGCGACVKKCPVDAITLVGKKAVVDRNKCIGCGVCKRFCGSDAIRMARRKKTQFVPKNSFERYVLEAIDSGTLQNLIFDNNDSWTYEVFRKFFGIILRLKPKRKKMADAQLRSRYIDRMSRLYYRFNKDAEKLDFSHPEMKRK